MEPILEIPTFETWLDAGGYPYHLTVQQISVSNQIEKYKVSGIKGSYIMLQSNRPFLRVTESHRQIHWSLIEGTVKNGKALAQIISKLESFIKNIESPVDPEWRAKQKRY